MKNAIILFSLCIASLGLQAQNNAISTFYTDYQEREDFVHISVTGTLFELFTHVEVEGDEAEEFKEFVTSIEFFEMVIGEEPVLNKSDYKNALSRIDKQYEELMSIEDKDGTFSFRIDEHNGIVREFLMVGLAGEDLIIFSLTGNMDLALLSKVGAQIQSDGFEYIEKLEKHGLDDVKVYPNPVQAGNSLNIEIPDAYVSGTATLRDVQGRIVMSYPMGLHKQRIMLEDVPAGHYIIAFEKDGLSQSRKLEVR